MTTENEQEKTEISASKYWPIFDRVASILGQARSNVVRAVNSSMVWAYRLIGRSMARDFHGAICNHLSSATCLTKNGVRFCSRWVHHDFGTTRI